MLASTKARSMFPSKPSVPSGIIFPQAILQPCGSLRCAGRRKGSMLKWSITCALIALKGLGRERARACFGGFCPGCQCNRTTCQTYGGSPARAVDCDPYRNAGRCAYASEAERDKVAQITSPRAKVRSCGDFHSRRGCRIDRRRICGGQSFRSYHRRQIRATGIGGIFSGSLLQRN